MTANTLHSSVRDAFRSTLRKGNQRSAFEQSVALLMKHRPDWLEPDVRRAVARMIAEEPGVHVPKIR